MKTQRIIVLTAAIAALLVIFAFIRVGSARPATLFAQSPAPPGPLDPAALPAHDKHEGLLIAADPYTDPERSKQTFGKNDPARAAFCPSTSISETTPTRPSASTSTPCASKSIRPDEDHQKVEALSVREVAVLVAHPRGPADPSATRNRIPAPIPMPKHDKAEEKAAAALAPFAFDSDVLPPRSTLHGFFFFDFGHDISTDAVSPSCTSPTST